MKTYLSLFFFIGIVSVVWAQDVKSSRFIDNSKIISGLQLSANSKSYTDLRDHSIYNISFPKDNFNVFFSSKLAYKAVYKNWSNREVLAVTEGIDLSKVMKMEKVVSPGKTTGTTIRMYFPAGHLKTRLIENGVIVSTVDEAFLEFFYPEKDDEKGNQLWLAMHTLVAMIKESKGVDDSVENIELGKLAALSKDNDKAKGYYQKAIGKGNSYAIYLMSGVVDNSEKDDWINKAIEAGDSYAMTHKAWKPGAIDWKTLEVAAVKGNPLAMYYLAYRENSKGNYQEQTSWYEKAVVHSQGSPYSYLAYTNLIESYINFDMYNKLDKIINDPLVYTSQMSREAIEINQAVVMASKGKGKEAVEILLSIAEQTSIKHIKADAYYQLGNIYEKGLGIKKNSKLYPEYKNISGNLGVRY